MLTRFLLLLLVPFVVLTACSSIPVKVQIWGEKGSEPRQFNEPFDVAVDQHGFVYVTDVRNKRVQKFTSEGNFILAFGQTLFEKPGGIGIGSDDTIWVTDYDLDRIFHFDPKGKLITAWGKAGDKQGDFASPVDVAVDSAGLVYVVDQYHHRIQQFSADGQFIRTWGKRGKINVLRSAINFILSDGHQGDFYYPSRIAIGADDRVYVSDAYNNRVQIFTADGLFLHSMGGMGIWGGRFRVASGLAISPDGSLFVADFYNNRIQHFDSNGNYLNAWGSSDLKSPTGVAVTPDNSVLVTDWENHRIQRFIPY